MDYNLFNKYFNGEASESEVEKLFNWINASIENRKEFIGYKKAWALIAKKDIDVDNVWKSSFVYKLKKQKAIRLYTNILKYAAIIIFVFSMGAAVQYALSIRLTNHPSYSANTIVKVPLGQMSSLELPDGTHVLLNSGTTIEYNGQLYFGKRIVKLEGEAYFDVSKDNKHPFIVETSSIDFKVYGTVFNIVAYPEDDIINTTLIEGSLGLISKSGKELTRITPGENAIFNKRKYDLKIGNVNTDLYTSWKDGLITFRNEKLKDIARKIERWYNVEIIINNSDLAEELYFGTIMKNKPIDQILEVLKLTSSLDYEIVTRIDKQTLIYWN